MVADRSCSTGVEPIAHTDEAVLDRAAAWLREGHGVAVATVVETWGSAPRPVGSRLAVCDDGRFVGSVSGGCVEADVVAEAVECIAEGSARQLEFGVADAVAQSVGLTCGGRVEIRVEPIVAGGFAPETLFDTVASLARRRATIRVVDLASGAERLVHADAPSPDAPSPDAADAADCAAVFASGASRCVGTGAERRFLSLTAPAVRLCVVGAVHISQTLAPMAAMVGLEVVVIDPRPGFATVPRFSGTPMVIGWPEDVVGRDIVFDAATAVVALAHRPEIDDPALIAALAADCFYVGALGSRRSHARRVERLVAAGVAASAVERIHAPIGLDIAAAGPAEIAVAILAEIVAVRRRARPARS